MNHEGDIIFVFGSNLAGIHGGGAALDARRYWGAVTGQGVGLRGNSYAIPTKDANIRTLPLRQIAKHVRTFVDFARNWRSYEFQVTRVGCGLAGYSDTQIAPMFFGAPEHCHLPLGWRQLGCPHSRRVTPEGWYTYYRCLDCGQVGAVPGLAP